MRFIETHSHFSDEAFDADGDAAVERAFAAGIDKIVDISCAANDWKKTLSICRKYPGRMYAAFGIHPEYAEKITPEQKEELKKYLMLPETVALGEIGTDYWWEVGTRESQRELLVSQLGLCRQCGKPAVFHARNGRTSDMNAYADLLDALSEWDYVTDKRFRGVLHCFCGSAADAKRALDNGLALGVNGSFTYKRNSHVRDVIKSAGPEYLVLETDCPYLPPEGYRGERNEPARIPEIAVFAAACLGIGTGKLAEITTKNAEELFGI